MSRKKPETGINRAFPQGPEKKGECFRRVQDKGNRHVAQSISVGSKKTLACSLRKDKLN
jgi:hypothetical protein